MQAFKICNTGIYDSKIAQPEVSVSHNRKTTRFELELSLENGGISYADSESAPITPHLFICAKPNQLRHTQFPFKSYYAHISVFDEELYNMLCATPTYVEIKDPAVYAEIFEELQGYSVMTSATGEIMRQSLILKLIYTLCEESKLNLTAKKYISTVNAAIDFINKNPTADLRLEAVARCVSMSPVHFHNTFKRATGRTLHEYVEERRITEAVNLMQKTDMTLTEVAFACGFSSQSYFSYVFKRRMKTTPRNYIKEKNEHYEI